MRKTKRKQRVDAQMPKHSWAELERRINMVVAKARRRDQDPGRDVVNIDVRPLFRTLKATRVG